MTTISAKAVLVSRNSADPNPDRKLATVLCRYPRWIHAELMTHRQFSRNAASSRAIPVQKMIDSIREDPAVPLFWGKNQKGMQAGDDMPDYVVADAKEHWTIAMANTIRAAEEISNLGAHKQIVNRLLEPFMHITALVSATEWQNFFDLRIHEAAEPHIRLLAERIKEAIDVARVQVLQSGDWHLPFITQVEADFVTKSHPGDLSVLPKWSTAMCASTSHKTVEGFDMNLSTATRIHDHLLKNKHWSPFEHVAKVDGVEHIDGDRAVKWDNGRRHANFVGFSQYRHMI